MASQRLELISSHLTAQPTASSNVTRIGAKSPDDIVIVSALRTPIIRARKGPFKDTLPEELLAAVLKATIEKTGIKPELVQDIAVGNVLPPGGGASAARMAALYAGFPESTAINTVNRQCSSGLQATVQIVTAIQTGLIDIGIGAGVESMTTNYGAAALGNTSEKIASANQAAADCLLPMGITSENVAADFGITRDKQDTFSARSHHLASAAQKAGLFNAEIIPVTTTVLDKDGKEVTVTVDKDDGIREGVTSQSLSKLKPAFSATGTTTAGNASQVSDGAAAVLLMKRATAERLGLPIQGKYITSAVVGVPPKIMGVGPAYAIPIALAKANIKVSDVDIFEINEAFASQAVYCVEKLGIDINKVNPKGGAIALGHPLGATGARQIATLLTELKRQNKRVGVTSMCIGSGMGMAAVFERE
ncbi:Thiolase, N-terminal domain-containing protein [Jimgerdemannia flammicorona]|uniref:acetyl-CoA C-acyltransferase n=1 Tax=Jimgerdemannia flammicorona TaxID=994334 RepID=A0A433QUV2_9FUNG|nr:Thiolase, N-terminal domain-containing protein [Jimgerdemannia flammicorona]